MKKMGCDHKGILLLVLSSAFVFNLFFCIYGFSFIYQPLNVIRACVFYCVPLLFFLIIRKIGDFRFRKIIVKSSLVISILSIALLLVDLWGGETGFLLRNQGPRQAESYRSDVNTWHRVVSLKELRDKNLTIKLETVRIDAIPPVHYVVLIYSRKLWGFLEQSQEVCQLERCHSAELVVSADENEIAIKPEIDRSGIQLPERHFSTTWNQTSPKIR